MPVGATVKLVVDLNLSPEWTALLERHGHRWVMREFSLPGLPRALRLSAKLPRYVAGCTE